MGAGLYMFWQEKIETNEPKDKFSAFGGELYEVIQDNYWEKVSDERLSSIFKEATIAVLGQADSLTEKNKEGVTLMLENSLGDRTDDEKRQAVIEIGSLIASNLPPTGIGGILSTKQETDLRNTVANIDTSRTLYDIIETNENADSDQIASAANLKIKEIAESSDENKEEKIKEVEYAQLVLTNNNNRVMYDESRIEPTIFDKKISEDTLYLHIKRFSPTTYNEFLNTMQSYGNLKAPQNLIIDIRGNIGGSTDVVPYILGLFVGQGKYVYDFYKQGEYIPTKTQIQKLPELSPFVNIVLLTDNGTQSSSELFVAGFKSYNIGMVLGDKTGGVGAIKNTFPLNTKISDNESHSLYMVHIITLTDNGQPIHGNGVEPDIYLKDKNWQNKLSVYYPQPFIREISDSINDRPTF
ncbi:MAG: hypothetical protein COV70_01580 [Parcubacteria group bacterium CG11_big_fil_rev_8_21_14_0_20_39_22]|nr:MAG: hypothetical protein COV70_01580 [Parcubacteria group bacterium CG11_big_fil_rev_8_21_14_0_20_39_22]